MKILSPDLLKGLLQHSRLVKEAVMMLQDHWDELLGNSMVQPKIDASVVRVAKQLAQAQLFESSLQFDDYQSVHDYVVHHGVYLTASGKQALLQRFGNDKGIKKSPLV